ncbi:MAG: hypothetical protein ACX932_04470 [Gammaproteobacteria bacterium]
MKKTIITLCISLFAATTQAAFVTIKINNQTPLTLNCTTNQDVAHGSLNFSPAAEKLSPGASLPSTKTEGIVAETSPSAKKSQGAFSCVSVGYRPITIAHVAYEQSLPALGLGKVDFSAEAKSDNQRYIVEKKIAPANAFVGNDADYENNMEITIKSATH